jgi:hypothetical protein
MLLEAFIFRSIGKRNVNYLIDLMKDKGGDNECYIRLSVIEFIINIDERG